MVWRIACLLIFFSVSAAVAAETLPQLVSHSEPLINAARGQKLSLQVELTDHSQALWYSSAKLLCSGTKCDLDTRQWSVGDHVIILLVFNEHGSHMVEFHLHLNSAAFATDVVTVPMVDAVLSPDSVGKDENYVISKANTGFSYRSDTPHRAQAKLQIVRNFPRKLDWNENLRSSQGYLKFGRLHADEHYLWPEGQLQLLRVDGDTRLVVLQHGILRSRNLFVQKPAPFTVIASNWLQIDGLAQADFVVEMQRENAAKAIIHVLRGDVQVRWRDPLLTPDVFGELSEEERAIEERMRKEAHEQVYIVSSGQRLEISTDGGLDLRYGPLQAKQIRSYLQETTPYVLGLEEMSATNGAQVFLDPARLIKTPIDADEALTLASQDLDKHDYLSILERLWGIASAQMEKRFEWHYLLGRAYAGLSMPVQAIKHLRQANTIRPDDPDVSFLIGRVSVEHGQWQQADSWLQKSLARGKNDSALFQYYSAVAAFQQRDWNRSRRHFLNVIHEEAHPEMVKSSQDFLEVLTEKQDFMADIVFALQQDSQIFGMKNMSRLQTHDTALSASGLGYLAGAQAKKRFAVEKPSDWSIFGHISRKGWLADELSEADRVDQGVGAEFRAGEGKRWQVATDLESIVIGSQRALDGIGLNLAYRVSNGFARPTINIAYRRYLDPLPGEADLIDPLSEEWQAVPSDRSSQLTIIGLKMAENLGYRWQLAGEASLWQRILVNELAKSLNERRLELRASVKWLWFSQVHLFASLELRKRDFLEASTDRQDFRLGMSTAVEWQFAGHWQGFTSILFQTQDSNQSDYSWTRSVIQSGLIYRF
ncbi:MAG: tetratricopeptide repeat protein [Oligoflexus sp.]